MHEVSLKLKIHKIIASPYVYVCLGACACEYIAAKSSCYFQVKEAQFE